MKESERLEVLSKIERNKKNLQKLDEMRDEIQQLKRDEKIRRYIELLENEQQLSSYLSYYNFNSNQIEYLEFLWAFDSRITSKVFEKCNHPLWLYLGSYGLETDSKGEYVFDYEVENEQDQNFVYNKYGCPECGTELIINEWNNGWKSFENGKMVYIPIKRNFDLYQRKYYELLMTEDVKTAQLMLVKGLKRKNED